MFPQGTSGITPTHVPANFFDGLGFGFGLVCAAAAEEPGSDSMVFGLVFFGFADCSGTGV
jgi:hypothetical protein